MGYLKSRTTDKTKSLGLFICVYTMGVLRLMYLWARDNAAPDYEESVLKYLDSLENVLRTVAGILL
jgi:hypothetical protein